MAKMCTPHGHFRKYKKNIYIIIKEREGAGTGLGSFSFMLPSFYLTIRPIARKGCESIAHEGEGSNCFSII